MSGRCPQVFSPFILPIKTPHFDYQVFKFYCYHAILKQLSTDFWLLLLLLLKLLYVFKSFNMMLLLFSCSVMSEFATKWTVAHQAFQSLIISWSLPKFMSIALVIPSSHPTPWCSLLLLPSIFPSIRDFSRESAVHIRWPKYRSFSFSISPSEEYSGLISLKIDWFDLFAVQRTFRCLL